MQIIKRKYDSKMLGHWELIQCVKNSKPVKNSLWKRLLKKLKGEQHENN